MFDEDRHVCRLAADAVRAAQAYAHAKKSCADVVNSAAALERSLLSLVEEVYAMEFELCQDRAADGSREGGTTSPGEAIHALAAEFIASLVQDPEEGSKAGELPLRTSVLLGNEFDALSDALRAADYLEPAARSRPVPA